MTSITQRLRIDIAALEAECAKRAAEVDAFRTVLAYYEGLEDAPIHVGRSLPLPVDEPPDMNEPIYKIVAEEGKPIHYRDVCHRLIGQGVRVKGKDPGKNVGAHMSYDPRIENVGKGMWGLKKWKQP